ncbi:hypothetical protein HK103_001068 [Boothiomyces macroporosus]|uniref:Uncharacterized protein n=1 Tax=Boothiomyces macroporosus TaxID=261099 RepID=A0AAD5Y0T5_9FUNG|nr:hypothetical protein HK103_001068 [Boothiomyces macroporosus]
MDGDGPLERVTLERNRSSHLSQQKQAWLFQLSLIQLVTTTAFNWATFGYGIIQTRQASTWASDSYNITKAYPDMVYKLNSSLLKEIDGGYPYGGASIALIVVLLFFCIAWIFLTWKLYYVFGWTTYKELGADVRVKMLAYGTNNGVDSNSAIALNVTVSVTGAVAILILAYYAVRKENKYLVYATLAGFLVAIGYVLSKFAAIYFEKDIRFESSKNSMTFFIVIMVLLSIATMVVAVLNMLQFGHGYINRDSSKDTLQQEYAI